MFGKLTLEAFPYDPIVIGASLFVTLIVCLTVGALFYFKRWKWLWEEWLTTVDHKKIGIMYLVVSFVMLLRGFSDAVMMRTQQAVAVGASQGFLPPDHYRGLMVLCPGFILKEMWNYSNQNFRNYKSNPSSIILPYYILLVEAFPEKHLFHYGVGESLMEWKIS